MGALLGGGVIKRAHRGKCKAARAFVLASHGCGTEAGGVILKGSGRVEG
jgi:hypothetical protein